MKEYPIETNDSTLHAENTKPSGLTIINRIFKWSMLELLMKPKIDVYFTNLCV